MPRTTSHKPNTYANQQPPEQEDDIDMELAEYMFDAGWKCCRNLASYKRALAKAIAEYKAKKRKGE